MKRTIFRERFDIRMTVEHWKIVKEIAKKEKTTISETIRRCIMDKWEKI